MEGVLEKLIAAHGLAGLVIAALGWFSWRKDKEVTQLHEARRKDYKDLVGLMLEKDDAMKDVLYELTEAVDRQADILERRATR